MIPIRNLYAMLAFAWRDMSLLDDTEIGACDFDRPWDVLARLFDGALRRVAGRGYSRHYVEIQEDGMLPRGRFDVERTLSGLLQPQGRLAYEFDELSEDTPENRLLKAAVLSLLHQDELGLALRHQLRVHAERLAGVTRISAREAASLRLRAPRFRPDYDVALWLASLVLVQALPDEGAKSDGSLRKLLEEDRLDALFEAFVRGAAAYFLRGRAKVSSTILTWQLDDASAEARALMPQMRTDVFIEHSDRAVSVLECKFYAQPLVRRRVGRAGDEEVLGQEKLRAGHLYQLMSYLHAVARDRGVIPSGALVYASPGGSLDERMRVEGYPFRVIWLDLSQRWEALREQVCALVEPMAVGGRIGSIGIATPESHPSANVTDPPTPAPLSVGKPHTYEVPLVARQVVVDSARRLGVSKPPRGATARR